jgi:hypothetical protein
VNDFGQTNPSGFWPGPFGALGQSLAFRLKSPLYFSVVYREAYLATRYGCMHAPCLKKPVRQKAAGFGEANPTVTQVEPNADLARTNPTQDFADGQRAGRTSLSRDRQRADGYICDCRRVVPQSFSPFSANEANLRKRSQRRKGKRNNAPRWATRASKDQVHARACYVPVRGRRDLLFVNPSK